MWPNQYMGWRATSSMPFSVGAHLAFIRRMFIEPNMAAATNRRILTIAFRRESSNTVESVLFAR